MRFPRPFLTSIFWPPSLGSASWTQYPSPTASVPTSQHMLATWLQKFTFLQPMLPLPQQQCQPQDCHSPVWLRLCTISTLGPMHTIPQMSHFSLPLGSRMPPGECGSWPVPSQ